MAPECELSRTAGPGACPGTVWHCAGRPGGSSLPPGLRVSAGGGPEHRKRSDSVLPLFELDSYQFSGKNGRETLATGKRRRQ